MKQYIFKHKFLLAVTLIVGAIYSVGSTLIALILRRILDVASAKDMNALFKMLIVTIIYLVVIGLSSLAYGILSKKFIGKVMYGLRTDVFNGVFQKNIQDFKSVNSADYLSALTNDVKLVEDNYLIPLLLSLQNMIIFITAFAIMLYFSPLVMLCLIAVTTLLIAIPNMFKGALQKRQDQFSKKLSGLTIVIKDFLSGFEVIRSYRMEHYVTVAFRDENRDTYETKYAMDRIVAGVESVSIVLGQMVQFSILFVCAYLIIKGEITVGMLIALVNVSGSMIAPIQILSQNIPKVQGTKSVIGRLKSFIDAKDSAFLGNGEPSFTNQITIRDLRFGYEDSHEVINGINFSFERNKKYALIGKSGCGKSTLVNLMTGYYSGYQGEICYDDQDIHQLDPRKLNEMVAVIHQNVYMFDESIEDNICLHKQVSDQDLIYALDMSGVKMFLNDTKNLDTLVGENGSNISGGQRQRIAVARALVQKKPILILDEGTSAIDMQTAYDIENRLLQLDHLTLITITHSLNSELLKNYDGIIFMEAGQICEFGTFDELVEARADFYEFYHVKTMSEMSA